MKKKSPAISNELFDFNFECSAAVKGAHLIAAAIIWMRGFNQESKRKKKKSFQHPTLLAVDNDS